MKNTVSSDQNSTAVSAATEEPSGTRAPNSQDDSHDNTTDESTVIQTSKVNTDSDVQKQVCNHYKRGTCRHGASGKKLVNNTKCPFMHPKKCSNYCKFGQGGCNVNCGLLHPILCENSVRFKKCFQGNCTFTHLLGTMRYPNRPQNQKNEVYTEYRNSSYNPPRSFYGGVRDEISQRNANRGYFHNYKEQLNQDDEYIYRKSDFPKLQNIQRNWNEMEGQFKHLQSCVDFIMQSAASNNLPKSRGLNYYDHSSRYHNTSGLDEPKRQSNQHLHEPKNFAMQNQPLYQ